MIEKAYWVAFSRISGIGMGHKRLRAILEHFGSLKTAWLASKDELLQVPDLPADVALKLASNRYQISLEEGLEILDKHKASVILRSEPEYPQALLKLKNPPFILFYKGIWDSAWFAGKPVSIVGSRTASEYAMSHTAELSFQLAERGYTIISGLAYGIDSAAHKGAFRCPHNQSVAVLPGGVDQITPISSKLIYQVLERSGCILSEHFPGTVPQKSFFPDRNRIIAALSKIVIVSEAKPASGSLITGEYALELDIPVFCLAGRADHEGNAGSHQWIKKGLARLITSYTDVLEEFAEFTPLERSQAQRASHSNPQEEKQVHYSPPTVPSQPAEPVKPLFTANLSDSERFVLEKIPSLGSITFDDLVVLLALPVSELNYCLMGLFVKHKLIRRLGDGSWVRAT